MLDSIFLPPTQNRSFHPTIELRFNDPLNKNRSFQRRSQPISWTVLRKKIQHTKNTNVKKASVTYANKIPIKLQQRHQSTVKFNDVCMYRCAQLLYTTQHRSVLIIFNLKLYTNITVLMQ